MKKLTVELNRSYDIIIGSSIIDSCGEYIKSVKNCKNTFIISDSNVSNIYLKRVKNSLTTAEFNVAEFVFEAGEKNKNFATVNDMVCAMADKKLTRSDVVIALGGGVSGDMAGFASAVYMRGIDFVQISTSLLSDIDSSVGGKTGCDLINGKNLIGAFHQPIMVLIDTDTLKTLDNRYFNDGMGEMIKYAIIRSKPMYNQILSGNIVENISELIYECVDIKRKIVENDEFEQGERKLLNFGHTLGHAIEKYYNFEKYSHGEAISIGMVMITKAAEKQGLSRIGLADDIIRLLKKYSLPYECDADMNRILEIVLSDKKCKNSSIDLIISTDIGESRIFNVKTEMLNEFFGV